ncbi:MAG: hypothetical protein WCI89_00275 [bacterium]
MPNGPQPASNFWKKQDGTQDEEKIALLTELWNERDPNDPSKPRYPASEIGTKMGATAEAITQKAKRLNLSRRTSSIPKKTPNPRDGTSRSPGSGRILGSTLDILPSLRGHQ